MPAAHGTQLNPRERLLERLDVAAELHVVVPPPTVLVASTAVVGAVAVVLLEPLELGEHVLLGRHPRSGSRGEQPLSARDAVVVLVLVLVGVDFVLVFAPASPVIVVLIHRILLCRRRGSRRARGAASTRGSERRLGSHQRRHRRRRASSAALHLRVKVSTEAARGVRCVGARRAATAACACVGLGVGLRLRVRRRVVEEHLAVALARRLGGRFGRLDAIRVDALIVDEVVGLQRQAALLALLPRALHQLQPVVLVHPRPDPLGFLREVGQMLEQVDVAGHDDDVGRALARIRHELAAEVPDALLNEVLLHAR